MTPSRIDPPAGPDIIEFLTSPKFLDKGDTSTAQRAILKAIYGLPMERDERLAFLEITEGREPRKGGYEEAALVCGVRSGKTDRIGATIATYETCRWGPVLPKILQPGQLAKGILIAQDERGAGEARGYIEGNLLTLHDRYGGILADTQGQERAITGRAIRTAWPVEIVIYPCRRAAVRGATGLWFVGDEIAWWESAEGAYNQDTKIIKAVRSRFATLARLHPKRIMISSPNEEDGVLWDEYRKRETSRTLVVKAPSWVLNPSIDEEFLEREQEKDPEGYLSEYCAEFGKPGGGALFLPGDAIDRCVDRSREMTPPKPGVENLAWLDAGFKHDRFSLGIGHAERFGEQTKVHIDFTKHWTPAYVAKGRKARPLDDRKVVAEAVECLRMYGCDRVHGDQYADIPLKSTFREYGIEFIECPISRPEHTDAMKNLRAAVRATLVDLPNDPILIKDLKGLVKKETSQGHIHVAAPKRKGCYDDAANVTARIVNRLLPLNASVDTSKWNDEAAPERWPGLDWRQPSQEGEFHGNLMEAVY